MKIKLWLKAFRLRTLPLTFAVIFAGTALSWNYIVYSTPSVPGWHVTVYPAKSIEIFFLTLLTALFLQILSNLANDYGDFTKGTDNENRIGPTRSLQSGGITKKQMFSAIVVFTFLSFISGSTLLYLSFTAEQIQMAFLFLGIGILSIAAAIKYTMGKSAYGYKALGDLAVFIFFGLVGVGGTYYLQANTITGPVLLTAAAFGLWSVAVLNLNNMRDVENDVVHQKFTLAYHLGFKGAKVYQILLMVVPYALLAFAFYGNDFFTNEVYVLAPLPLTLVVVYKIIAVKNRRDFDPFLKIQALLTLVNSIVLWTCLYLHYGETLN